MSALKFLLVAAWLVIPGISLPAKRMKQPLVEVFTLSDRPVRGVDALERRGITVDVYVVDAVEQIESDAVGGFTHECASSHLNGLAPNPATVGRSIPALSTGRPRAFARPALRRSTRTGRGVR